MNKQDQRFYDSFMLVLGIFAGLILGVIFMKAFTSAGDSASMSPDPSAAAMVEERIRPIGRVALLGDPDVGVRPVIATDSQTADGPMSGPQVYNDICYLCHAEPGVAGAPVLGDVAVWTPRMAQGMEILQDRVINGYQGEAGFMPPKGGRMDLSDDEVIAALEFMLDEVQ